MTKAIGYLRVSTEEQAQSGLGLAAQKAAIEEACEREGLELVAIHSDDGVSGAREPDKRPGLLQAIRALDSDSVLIVAKIDRIGRDMFVNAVTTKLVESKGATIFSADGNGNGSGPEADLMRNILTAFAVFERALISCRTKAALAAKAATGYQLGQPAYGENLVDGVLTVNEDEAPTVALILDLAKEGHSRRAIARELNARNITTKRGKVWTHVQVGSVLNRFEGLEVA